jgi:hypothetical protein
VRGNLALELSAIAGRKSSISEIRRIRDRSGPAANLYRREQEVPDFNDLGCGLLCGAVGPAAFAEMKGDMSAAGACGARVKFEAANSTNSFVDVVDRERYARESGDDHGAVAGAGIEDGVAALRPVERVEKGVGLLRYRVDGRSGVD